MGSGLLSPGHIAILLVIVLLVFGAKRLPEVGRSLGQGMREFKESVTGESEKPAEIAAPTQIAADSTDAETKTPTSA
jgi:sec-independent protein translocase protein TatA